MCSSLLVLCVLEAERRCLGRSGVRIERGPSEPAVCVHSCVTRHPHHREHEKIHRCGQTNTDTKLHTAYVQRMNRLSHTQTNTHKKDIAAELSQAEPSPFHHALLSGMLQSCGFCSRVSPAYIGTIRQASCEIT